MNDLLMQLVPMAQQYLQSPSPQTAAQLLQMVSQSGDPNLLQAIADQIAQLVLQSTQGASQGGQPMGNPAAMSGVPLGAMGMNLPMYAKGGKVEEKRSAVDKLVEKRKKTGKPNG